MNWYKIKTVLIILFLCIDIFLILWNNSLDTMSDRVDGDTVSRSVSLLKENGITIDESLISLKTPKIKNLTLINAVGNQAQFLENTLVDGYIKNGNEFFVDDNKVIIENNSFAVVSPGSVVSTTDAKDFLSARKFDLSNATVKETDAGFVFTQTIDNYEIYGSQITVFSIGNTTTASGVWATPKADGLGKNISVRHITSVFPQFITDPARPVTCEITGIELGYATPSVLSDAYDVFVEGAAVCVWRITLSDGQVFYYNAAK